MSYDGWTVRYGFLTGSLGDHESDAGAYAEAVEEALCAHYPGACVDVVSQDGCGSKPMSLRTLVTDTEGNEVYDQDRVIGRIAEDVFQSGTWVTD